MSPQQVPQARVQFLMIWVLAGLALLALCLKLVLQIQNARLEIEIAEKQYFVSESLPISRLNVQLVQSIANAAARSGDPGLTALLAGQGIQFEVKRKK